MPFPIPSFLSLPSFRTALLVALAVSILRGNMYRDDRDHWRSAFAAQKAAFTAAQHAATARAIAVRVRTESTTATIARNADAQILAPPSDLLRAAAADFAAARRLRPETACRPASRPAAAAASGPAPDHHRPGDFPLAIDAAHAAISGSPDSILLTRPEYDSLAASGIRLAAVHDWGAALIAAGLAVPEADYAAEPIPPP